MQVYPLFYLEFSVKGQTTSWAWRQMPIILALKQLRKEGYKFKTTLSYIARPRNKELRNSI